MTEDELVALEALTEQATPGPWAWIDLDLHALSVENDDPWDPAPGKQIIITDGGAYPPEKDDAAFIAASRTAVPALIAEVRRLREALIPLAEQTVTNGGPYCFYCNNYLEPDAHEHQANCPWAKTRAALGLDAR